jgi:hypothetical protein
MVTAVVPVHELVPISLTKPIVAIGLTAAVITLGGFGILMEGAIKLSRVFQQTDPVIALLVLGMFTILLSDFMLFRVLSRIIRASLERGKEAPALPARLPGREVPRQMGPQFEPVASVTEHTTRTFSPVFREPSDRGTK